LFRQQDLINFLKENFLFDIMNLSFIQIKWN
jgi:hypothetical protein